MNRRSAMVLFAVLLLCAAAAAAREPDVPQATASAETTETNEAMPQNDAFVDVSEEGRFETLWPAGCAKRRLRFLPSSHYEDRYYVVDVTCDRGDEGNRVTVYFETAAGGSPEPSDVTASISKLVGTLGVEIQQQRAIKRGEREGVAVYCREPGSERRVWMEGFLAYGRAVVAMAWGEGEGFWTDPGTIRFFSALRVLP